MTIEEQIEQFIEDRTSIGSPLAKGIVDLNRRDLIALLRSVVEECCELATREEFGRSKVAKIRRHFAWLEK